MIKRRLIEWAIGLSVALAMTGFAQVEREQRKNHVEEQKNIVVSNTLPKIYNCDNDLMPTITIHREEVKNSVDIGEYTITGYCSCEICCGEYAKNRPNGIVYGASGEVLRSNYSVASPLPFGTKLEIDGLGEYVVQDRTADWIVERYDGKIIDIYFNTHEQAVKFAKQVRNVSVVKE